MGHSAAIWDYKVANEITSDWNGTLQVVLRNPQGASARVSLSVWLNLSLLLFWAFLLN